MDKNVEVIAKWQANRLGPNDLQNHSQIALYIPFSQPNHGHAKPASIIPFLPKHKQLTIVYSDVGMLYPELDYGMERHPWLWRLPP